MPSFQFVCGEENGPEVGQLTFTSKLLRNIVVNFIIIDNNILNQLEPDPDFKHDYLKGKIDRSPTAWILGNKLIVDYTPCNCDK